MLAESLTPVILAEGRRVLFTHRALLEAEAATGRNMLAPLPRPLSATLLRALYCAGSGIETFDLDLTPQAAFMLQGRIFEAWAASMAPRVSETIRKGSFERKPKGTELTWPRAWAHARMELGLSEDEWLDITPRMLHELDQVRRSMRRREDYLVGVLASKFINFSMRHSGSPVTAQQVMGLDDDLIAPEDRGPVTGEMLMAVFAPFPKTKPN